MDKVAGLFTWIMIIVASTTFTTWYLIFEASLETSLVPACWSRNPTAVVAGVNVATREGNSVRNVVALEKACEIDVVAFDKTGTIMVGRFKRITILSFAIIKQKCGGRDSNPRTPTGQGLKPCAFVHSATPAI